MTTLKPMTERYLRTLVAAGVYVDPKLRQAAHRGELPWLNAVVLRTYPEILGRPGTLPHN